MRRGPCFMQPDSRTFLFDVQQAIALIVRFVQSKSRQDYEADDLLRAAVEREFIIIGEALQQARRLDPQVVASIPDSQRIINFRNVLVHGYASIDSQTVWSVIEDDLPPLMAFVDGLLTDPDAAP